MNAICYFANSTYQFLNPGDFKTKKTTDALGKSNTSGEWEREREGVRDLSVRDWLGVPFHRRPLGYRSDNLYSCLR